MSLLLAQRAGSGRGSFSSKIAIGRLKAIAINIALMAKRYDLEAQNELTIAAMQRSAAT
jgi:hypothetical protein